MIAIGLIAQLVLALAAPIDSPAPAPKDQILGLWRGTSIVRNVAVKRVPKETPPRVE